MIGVNARERNSEAASPRSRRSRPGGDTSGPSGDLGPLPDRPAGARPTQQKGAAGTQRAVYNPNSTSLGATLIGEASELLDKSRAALARAGESIVGDGAEGSATTSDSSSGNTGSDDAGSLTGEAPDKG
jgi:hypothetical protein